MLHFISAENIRKPLQGILDSIITQHISHRLVDDFLILTPDDISAQDIQELLLQDSRLGSVLTGQSVLTLKRWIEKCSDETHPKTRAAPAYVLEALFKQVLANDLSASYSHLSSESLFLLIQSFRNEFLPSSALLHFLENFDPDLAHECLRCYEKYELQIHENFYLKDFVWQANEMLEKLAQKKIRNLENIRRIYYLGFIDFSPLLKKHALQIEKHDPHIEQLILCQKPTKIETQDYFSKTWGEVPKNLHEFKKAEENLSITSLEYAGPFDEVSDIHKQIIQRIQEGLPASSIALFLPSDDFLKSYHEQQLFKLGLHPVSQTKKRFSQFSILQDSFSLSAQEGWEHVNKIYLEKRKNLSTQTSPFLAEDLKCLEGWMEILEEILFYQEEYPELKKHFSSLQHIAHHEFLKSRQSFHEGVQIRSLFQPGLKSYTQSYLPQITEDVIPQNTERFFAFHLPLFDKEMAHQQNIFQHLLNAGTHVQISYPKIGLQTQEKSPSPFMAGIPLQTQNKSCKTFWITNGVTQDIQKRLEVEIKRQKDPESHQAHGGWIQNKNTLKKLHHWIEQKTFSPSRLEKYAQCPFSFFANSLLGLEKDEEKSLEGDAREQGKWVHQLLESFFSRNIDFLKQAGTNPSLRDLVFQKLEVEIQNLSGKFLKEKQWIHPLLFEDFSQRVKESSQDILNLFWKQWDEKKTQNFFIPRFFEKEFGKEQPLVFQKSSLPPLRLKGRIDRIDVSEDGKQFITWDYKTGNLQGFTSEIMEFKKLQVPLYLLASEKMNELKNKEGIASLALGLQEITYNQGIAQKEKASLLGFKGHPSCLLDEKNWENFWKQFEEKLLNYFEKIYQGDFRTVPDPCSEFCEYRNICRYHERKKA